MANYSLSRRRFLGQSGALFCACHAPLRAFANSSNPRITPALSEFGYGNVRLEDSPLRDQFVQQQNLYLEMDDDRLLKPFRVRAGMDAPGVDMGGWYDESKDFLIDPSDWSKANWHGFIPGHSFGQYLSGLARGPYDDVAREKIARLVGKFAKTISPRFFDDYNLPAYTYDKLVVGLIDAYRFANVTEAREALDKLTDAALPYLPEKALTREERRARPYLREAQIWDEPYTLPENLFLAYDRGMGERYRDLAIRFLQDDALFDPLAKGVSPFKGKHAYSHVNALCSAVQAYLHTRDEKYLAAARNGFALVQAQSYATGGWGPNEELLAADDTETLFDMLKATHRSFETPCGAYAHFKLTRYLLRLTKDSRYGDSMERVLYNTILGAKPTKADGETFYYSDYNEHANKFYRGEKWPCCSGTFVQLTADYGISAYLSDDENIYVNLYVPSRVNTDFRRTIITVNQSTDYPFGTRARFLINASRPREFGLCLRLPAWAGPQTKITINGKTAPGKMAPGTFATLRRKWKNGDVVEITFDMGLRLEPLNAAHPEMVALLTGPLVLFPVEAPETPLTREQWLSATRGTTGEWSVAAGDSRIRLKPFMAIGDETYRLYSRLKQT
jgi:hypothetical protein